MTSSVAPHHGIVCPLVIRRPASSQWMGKHHFAEMKLNTSLVSKIASDDLTFNFQNQVMCVVGNALPEMILYVFVFPSYCLPISTLYSIQVFAVWQSTVWPCGGWEVVRRPTPRDKKGWTSTIWSWNVSPKGLHHGIRGWFKLDSGS